MTLTKDQQELMNRLGELVPWGMIDTRQVLCGVSGRKSPRKPSTRPQRRSRVKRDISVPPELACLPYEFGLSAEIRPQDQISGRYQGNPELSIDLIKLVKAPPHNVPAKKRHLENWKEELEDKPVLTVQVLSHLLRNTRLVTEQWGRFSVFFWGTISRSSRNSLYVPYIHFSSGKLYVGMYWTQGFFGKNFYAAVLAA